MAQYNHKIQFYIVLVLQKFVAVKTTENHTSASVSPPSLSSLAGGMSCWVNMAGHHWSTITLI